MATWRDRLWRVVVAFLLIFGQLCSDYGNLAAKSSTKGQIIGVPKGRAAAAIPEAHRPHSEQFRPRSGLVLSSFCLQTDANPRFQNLHFVDIAFVHRHTLFPGRIREREWLLVSGMTACRSRNAGE
jgi:hypothetical protein